jgi:SsrA-binding protein
MNKISDAENSPRKIIAVNRKARYEFSFEEYFEAGLVLQGWEIKSLRAGKVQISDAYILIKKGETWMIGSLITPLLSASTHIHPEANRTRKLLLHKSQIRKLIGLVERQGYTLIPLSLYWCKGLVKLEFGLAKGKKKYDKRETEKDRDWQRMKQRLSKKQM